MVNKSGLATHWTFCAEGHMGVVSFPRITRRVRQLGPASPPRRCHLTGVRGTIFPSFLTVAKGACGMGGFVWGVGGRPGRRPPGRELVQEAPQF